MATEQRGYCDGSMVAAADLRTSQYKYVKITSTGTIDVCSASTDKAIGVLQNKPNTGETCDVMVTGRTKLLAGAAVANAGTDLMPDATGRAIAAVTASNQQFGRNVTVASGAGVVMEAIIPGIARTI